MQQPSNQPGGPNGSAPYASPPPKSGFSLLTCCLGCVGVVVVLVVILGVLVGVKLRRASGSQITAANFRQEFPTGVPVYPDLTLDEQATARMHYAGGIFGLFPYAGVRMRMMAFKSNARLKVIGPWYKKRLVPLGWKVTGARSPESPTGVQFEKGDTSFLVANSDDGAGVTIMVSHGSNGRPSPGINPQ